MSHALLVGATGMLADVALALAGQGFDVSSLARSPSSHARLRARVEAAGGRYEGFIVDYTDSEALDHALRAASARFGPPALAVAWVHGHAPRAPLQIAGLLAEADLHFVHVLGSASADPARPDPGRRASFEAMAHVALYTEVVLGFVMGARGARWLTDAEICAGVLDAIARAEPRRVVGQVRPWEARP